jgi:hypothetical protein
MALVGFVVRRMCVVAVRGAARAFAGFATFGRAHIRGLGTPRPLLVARPLSKVERARPEAGAQATVFGHQAVRRRQEELLRRLRHRHPQSRRERFGRASGQDRQRNVDEPWRTSTSCATAWAHTSTNT